MDTKKLRQKILDLAIHGKLVPQDPNDEPASVLLERIRAEKERLIKEGKIKRSRKTTKTSDAACDKQEVPFEVPSGWVWTTLDEICSKIGSGSTPRGSNYSEDGIPFFRSQNVHNEGLVYEDIKFISNATHQSMIGTEVCSKDLLLNITGGSLGRCAIVPDDFLVGNVSQHVCIIRTICVLPSYVHAFILSSLFKKSMSITGSGREGLPKYNLEKMYLSLPPLAEQQRIVEEIERWFKLIEIIEQGKADLQTTIKQAKNKILELAIHGKLVPQDPNDEPALELLKRINPKAEITCDNGHYPKLPKGWCLCKLKNISLIITGSTPSKSNSAYYGGKVPFYKPIDLDAGRFVDSSAEYLSEAGKAISRVVPIGSTAVCCIGSIGKAGYLIKEGTTNQQINCVIPSEAVDSVFLYYLCTSPLFYQELITLSSAVTISIINKSKMENIIVPLPPIEEQKRIVSKIEDLFGFIKTIEESL